MTTNYHTAIAYGAEATSAVVNSPLSELDTQLTATQAEVTAARGSKSSLDARLDISLTDAGLIAAGAVSAQSMISLNTAAATDGDAVRYQEFVAEHAANGTHSTSATIITKQAQVALDAAATTNGDAVRYEEFSAQHDAIGEHRTDVEIIGKQAQVNLEAAASTNGDVVRYEEFAAQHVAATGAHRTDVEIITKQAQVNLDAAASTNGDAVRYEEYAAHAHAARYILYMQSIDSAADNTDADALRVFSKSDADTKAMTAFRVGFYKTPEIDSIVLRGAANFDPAGGSGPSIKLICSTGTATYSVTESLATAFETALNIGALGDDAVYEVLVTLQWATADAGAHAIKLTKPSIWAEPTTAPA